MLVRYECENEGVQLQGGRRCATAVMHMETIIVQRQPQHQTAYGEETQHVRPGLPLQSVMGSSIERGGPQRMESCSNVKPLFEALPVLRPKPRPATVVGGSDA
jgi:hypothetical protein